jgi:type I restriction enzyme R subunit
MEQTVEMEANQAALARTLAEMQNAAEAQPQQTQIEFKQAGLHAARRLELDKRQTRRLIDVQLSEGSTKRAPNDIYLGACQLEQRRSHKT